MDGDLGPARGGDAGADARAHRRERRSATGATRARIAQGLLLGIERLSVVRALEAIFNLGPATPELGGLAAPAGIKLLDHWIQPEITPEELQAVLSAAAGAACRPEVPARSPQARKLRERASELLLDALCTGSPWARATLQKMRDSAAIPARMRKEIAGRLDQAISVLRLDRRNNKGLKPQMNTDKHRYEGLYCRSYLCSSVSICGFNL